MEMVGLSIPFLTNPFPLKGEHIVLQVDNKVGVNCWKKKYVIQGPEYLTLTMDSARALGMQTLGQTFEMHVKPEGQFGRPPVQGGRLPARKFKIPNKGFRKQLQKGALIQWSENLLLDWDLSQKIVNGVEGTVA
jgi:hypothetical protein